MALNNNINCRKLWLIWPISIIKIATILFVCGFSGNVFASDQSHTNYTIQATSSYLGILCLVIFCVAYVFVVLEEVIHLRKSKPVVFAAGIIWIIVSYMCIMKGNDQIAHAAVQETLTVYAGLLLFLLVAMTYINTMEERNIFKYLKVWLIKKGFTLRECFWVTGILAFFISPIADNLTTAIAMCAIVMAMGEGNPKFVRLACINIVVAANAGGAFSPFGDITTLMVWQKGILPFEAFFRLFVPSVVNFLIPATIMHFFIPKNKPNADFEYVALKFGAKRVVILFILTIATAVLFHTVLHMPPTIGMMTGLGYLFIFSYYLKKREQIYHQQHSGSQQAKSFDIFNKIRNAEWDTLFFFYGVMLCVGGLALIGYLELISTSMYDNMGKYYSEIHKATPANIAVGILSAIIDNIPVMFSVLTMYPKMSQGQWLLVTLTVGIGGSLLSIGSAAGVALMGQSRGVYTFLGHLKWAWAILLGYFGSIIVHIWLNYDLFSMAIT